MVSKLAIIVRRVTQLQRHIERRSAIIVWDSLSSLAPRELPKDTPSSLLCLLSTEMFNLTCNEFSTLCNSLCKLRLQCRHKGLSSVMAVQPSNKGNPENLLYNPFMRIFPLSEIFVDRLCERAGALASKLRLEDISFFLSVLAGHTFVRIETAKRFEEDQKTFSLRNNTHRSKREKIIRTLSFEIPRAVADKEIVRQCSEANPRILQSTLTYCTSILTSMSKFGVHHTQCARILLERGLEIIRHILTRSKTTFPKSHIQSQVNPFQIRAQLIQMILSAAHAHTLTNEQISHSFHTIMNLENLTSSPHDDLTRAQTILLWLALNKTCTPQFTTISSSLSYLFKCTNPHLVGYTLENLMWVMRVLAISDARQFQGACHEVLNFYVRRMGSPPEKLLDNMTVQTEDSLLFNMSAMLCYAQKALLPFYGDVETLLSVVAVFFRQKKAKKIEIHLRRPTFLHLFQAVSFLGKKIDIDDLLEVLTRDLSTVLSVADSREIFRCAHALARICKFYPNKEIFVCVLENAMKHIPTATQKQLCAIVRCLLAFSALEKFPDVFQNLLEALESLSKASTFELTGQESYFWLRLLLEYGRAPSAILFSRLMKSITPNQIQSIDGGIYATWFTSLCRFHPEAIHSVLSPSQISPTSHSSILTTAARKLLDAFETFLPTLETRQACYLANALAGLPSDLDVRDKIHRLVEHCVTRHEEDPVRWNSVVPLLAAMSHRKVRFSTYTSHVIGSLMQENLASVPREHLYSVYSSMAKLRIQNLRSEEELWLRLLQNSSCCTVRELMMLLSARIAYRRMYMVGITEDEDPLAVTVLHEQILYILDAYQRLLTSFTTREIGIIAFSLASMHLPASNEIYIQLMDRLSQTSEISTEYNVAQTLWVCEYCLNNRRIKREVSFVLSPQLRNINTDCSSIQEIGPELRGFIVQILYGFISFADRLWTNLTFACWMSDLLITLLPRYICPPSTITERDIPYNLWIPYLIGFPKLVGRLATSSPGMHDDGLKSFLNPLEIMPESLLLLLRALVWFHGFQQEKKTDTTHSTLFPTFVPPLVFLHGIPEEQLIQALHVVYLTLEKIIPKCPKNVLERVLKFLSKIPIIPLRTDHTSLVSVIKNICAQRIKHKEKASLHSYV